MRNSSARYPADTATRRHKDAAKELPQSPRLRVSASPRPTLLDSGFWTLDSSSHRRRLDRDRLVVAGQLEHPLDRRRLIAGHRAGQADLADQEVGRANPEVAVEARRGAGGADEAGHERRGDLAGQVVAVGPVDRLVRQLLDVG